VSVINELPGGRLTEGVAQEDEESGGAGRMPHLCHHKPKTRPP